MSTYKIDQKAFLTAAKSALVAAGKLDVRYYLNGVCIEFGSDSVRLVSTDGHRLFKCDIAAKLSGEKPEPVIICRNSLEALLKAAKPCRHYGDEWLTLTIDGSATQAICHSGACMPLALVDGRFPDWQRVVPNYEHMEPARAFGIDPDYLADAGKALKPFGNKKGTTIKMETGDSYTGIRFSIHGPEHGEGNTYPGETFYLVMPMRL